MVSKIDDRPISLSGNFVGSFAYITIRDRLPGILTKVIDGMSQLTGDYLNKNDQDKAEDTKNVIGKLSKLRNELQTDKTLTLLEDSNSDVSHWNDFINKMAIINQAKTAPSWFSVAWLSCECYMYRKIFSELKQSKYHQDFDPFLKQKNDAFQTSVGAMKTLGQYLLDILSNEIADDNLLRRNFEFMLEYCLWGNKCDLSISAGVQVYNQLNESDQLKSLLEHIICNHTNQLWEYIKDTATTRKQKNESIRIDFILDNAGFELFTDLCFAEFLLNSRLCDVVHFHVKNMPWFVSDTMKTDFVWTIEQCVQSSETELQTLGKKWKSRLENGSFIITENPYWSLPDDFASMKRVSPDLYSYLGSSQLLIFKGDLNHRKLLGDRNWPHTTSFQYVLCGFFPAPLCTLRTLKADLVVGLKENQAEELQKKSEKWMVSGEYAVIQFCGKLQ